MPTTTYVALANTTLSGTDTTVTFASIPNTYRHLALVCVVNTGAGNIRGRFNGDTGSNYLMTRMFAYPQGVSAGCFSSTHFEWGDVTGRTTLLIDILDYSATDKNKFTLSKDASNGANVFYHANRWGSTSAVTQIDIFRSTGDFSAGDTFALYGIVS